MKKKLSSNATQSKRKRAKTSNPDAASKALVQNSKPEFLDHQTIREGMLLLGCVIEVRPNCILMSLPGCMVGTVPLLHVSQSFTKLLRDSAERQDVEEVPLNSIVDVGAVLPCKVLQVAEKKGLKKVVITLTINPSDVNSDLRSGSIYPKMILHSAVESVEDRGYVMDIGIKGMQGFLSFSTSGGNEALKQGQVVPTCVKKMPSKEGGNVVWLKLMSFNETFPEIEDGNMKLSSILPGANVTAYATEIKQPFLHFKCMSFKACASGTSLSHHKNLENGSRIPGTVLYVHPVTNIIYLLIDKKPTPETFKTHFRFEKFAVVQTPKYQHAFHNKELFSVGKGTNGFVRKAELPNNGDMSTVALSRTTKVKKARIVFLHYLDNLVQLTFKDALVNMDIKKVEDVAVGDICEAVVNKHLDSGMFVSICPGLKGFIRRVHLSDSMVSLPAKLHPLFTKVKCRVLCKDPMNLTCKESLLRLKNCDILQSYEQAQRGNCFKGVIVQITFQHVLVLFFNNVQGIVPRNLTPESSVLFVGQTVSCQVVHCDPKNRKIRLSFECDGAIKKNQASNADLTQTNKRQRKTSSGSNVSDDEEMWRKCVTTPPSGNGILTEDINERSFPPHKPQKAIIKNVTGHQLNIVLGKSLKGRVHITEIGCSSEDSRPLHDFSSGQIIKVYVMKTYDQRARNFLQITHQNTKRFLECSLAFSPPVDMDQKLTEGEEVLGFVKEVSNTCASIWVSPYQTGTLEYLHYSTNPKVLRKLKRTLKPGLSIKASILSKLKNSKNSRQDVQLTKLGNIVPEAGSNIVGLVQIASPEKGMVLKLPGGYHGSVALTDIQDVYGPVSSLLEKYKRRSFILCNVLEVDHVTKYCQLSLRKSRLYQDHSNNICPELTIGDLESGKVLKGIIKTVVKGNIVVTVGRNLDGKVLLHKCTVHSCRFCKHSENILQKITPGQVMDVMVNEESKKNAISFTLPEFAGLGVSETSRLNVTEDINWEDV